MATTYKLKRKMFFQVTGVEGGEVLGEVKNLPVKASPSAVTVTRGVENMGKQGAAKLGKLGKVGGLLGAGVLAGYGVSKLMGNKNKNNDQKSY